MKYDVKIIWGCCHPFPSELTEMIELFNNSNFQNFLESDILYFASGSKTAFYDFKISEIDHDEKTVLLVVAVWSNQNPKHKKTISKQNLNKIKE